MRRRPAAYSRSTWRSISGVVGIRLASSVARASWTASKLRSFRSVLVIILFSVVGETVRSVRERIHNCLADRGIGVVRQKKQPLVDALVRGRRPLQPRDHVALMNHAVFVRVEQREHA